MLMVVSLADNIFDKLQLFIDVGVVLFIISCFGCIGAATWNGCCLTCYSILRMANLSLGLGLSFTVPNLDTKNVVPIAGFKHEPHTNTKKNKEN